MASAGLAVWLLADSGGVGALGVAGEVCGGGGDGKAEAGDDGAGDGGFGDAKGEVAGVGGDAEGKPGAGFDDDGERARPELFGKSVEGGVELAGELVGLGYLGDEEREGLVAGAGPWGGEFICRPGIVWGGGPALGGGGVGGLDPCRGWGCD